MGQRLIHLAQEDKELTVGAALESPGHPKLGQDAGEVAGLGKLGVSLTSDIATGHPIHVMVDFSVPAGTMQVLKLCTGRRLPLVVATTGHTPEQRREIEEAAHET